VTARHRGALLAGACLGGAVTVWAVVFHVGGVARFDGRLLDAFRGLGQPGLGPIDTARVQALVDPKPFLLASELLVAAALVRRRPTVALAVAAMLLCANLTSQVLKPLLAAPRGWGVDPSSWPSGHATAAMTLALCGLLIAPRNWRPVVCAAGAVFALAVGGSILVEGGHFPSDVLGGYLVAGVWAGLAVVALDLIEVRRPALARLAPTPRRWQVRAAAGVATGVAVGVAMWQTGDVPQFVTDNTKFVVVAAAIALGSAALVAGTRSSRRRPVAPRFR